MSITAEEHCQFALLFIINILIIHVFQNPFLHSCWHPILTCVTPGSQGGCWSSRPRRTLGQEAGTLPSAPARVMVTAAFSVCLSVRPSAAFPTEEASPLPSLARNRAHAILQQGRCIGCTQDGRSPETFGFVLHRTPDTQKQELPGAVFFPSCRGRPHPSPGSASCSVFFCLHPCHPMGPSRRPACARGT